MSPFADLTRENRHRYATQASLIAATSAELARALVDEDDHSVMHYCTFLAITGEKLLGALSAAFNSVLNAEFPDTIEELLASTTINEKLVNTQESSETKETGNADDATTTNEP